MIEHHDDGDDHHGYDHDDDQDDQDDHPACTVAESSFLQTSLPECSSAFKAAKE